MDLVTRFKKDYLNYLVSTIIPVIITAVSIPLFKQILGAGGYGNFALTFNSVLLCTAVLSGWIWPSILRYFPASNDKKAFSKQALLLSAFTQALFFTPVLAIVWYLKQDFLIALLFAITLFVTSMQFSLLALGQSVFLSKKSINYEFIRAVSYISLSLFMLKFTSIYYMYSLFCSVIVSYLLSFFYLYREINKKLAADYSEERTVKTEGIKKLFREFVLYGGPLSLWFVFGALVTLSDKYFILRNLGAEIQGNYQAMFDFLSKSITIIITPIVISLFPLLTNAFETGEQKSVRVLVKKIILAEVLGLVLAIICYWLFGAKLLFDIIHIPDTLAFRQTGAIVIAATFIWQIAMVIQKKYELHKRNRYLLLLLAMAFSFQLIFYVFFRHTQNQLIFPLGYLVCTCIYLFLVSFSDLLAIFKSVKLNQ